MSGGERPIGAAKGKQPNTEALCQPPPPPAFGEQMTVSGPVKKLHCFPEEMLSDVVGGRDGLGGPRSTPPPPSPRVLKREPGPDIRKRASARPLSSHALVPQPVPCFCVCALPDRGFANASPANPQHRDPHPPPVARPHCPPPGPLQATARRHASAKHAQVRETGRTNRHDSSPMQCVAPRRGRG